MKIIKETNLDYGVSGKGPYKLIKYYDGEIEWVKSYKTQSERDDALIEYSNMYSYSPEVRFDVKG